MCEHIQRPVVQRVIALVVAGLIALLLSGSLLLSGHGACVNRLPMQAVRTSEGMVVERSISTSLPAIWRAALAVSPVVPGSWGPKDHMVSERGRSSIGTWRRQLRHPQHKVLPWPRPARSTPTPAPP